MLPSSNAIGELGLNTVPSARMSPEGTIRAHFGRQEKYSHATLGVQVSDRLYLGLRQTAESENFHSETLNLYPGLDTKYLLFRERRFVPQIAVGLQSAFGHKRMAAEYLSMSKRYENLDFTFGFGWGRMASGMHLPNPILINHLSGSGARSLDGDKPNTPHDWFKGDMGLFGGIEYNTAINGLSLKADWNSDAWTAEKIADATFKAPAPWSLGLSYRPYSWLDTSIATSGFDNLMFHMTFNGNVSNWIGRKSNKSSYIALLPRNENTSSISSVTAQLFLIQKTTDYSEATLILDNNYSSPEQIGNALRYLANQSNPHAERLILHLVIDGLYGQTLTINRQDIERADLSHQGSAEEIWQTAEFAPQRPSPLKGNISLPGSFKLSLLNDVSLSEHDSGVLYRSGLIGTFRKNLGTHFLSIQSLRLNIADNLNKLSLYRGTSLDSTRGDIDSFTQNRILIDRSYFMELTNLTPSVFIASRMGYLEEMYAGLTGELLYRPFSKNWAIGIETSYVGKRDPLTFSALGLTDKNTFSGFIDGYYEVPATGITLKTSLGRFLAGDLGGTFELSNEFQNGVKLSAHVSASIKSDADIYGGRTNVYTGMKVILPLENVAVLPNGSDITTSAHHIGRNTAQRLDLDMPLYERTEPLSYRHITRHWSQMTSATSQP